MTPVHNVAWHLLLLLPRISVMCTWCISVFGVKVFPEHALHIV